MNTSNVEISKIFNIYFWLKVFLKLIFFSGIIHLALNLTAAEQIPLLVSVATVAIVLFPTELWYKLAVINRTKVLFEKETRKLLFQKGRYFVADDDIIPVTAVDNVKLNRSILGKIFGWCDIQIDTRVESYTIPFVDTRGAEQFRMVLLEAT